VTTKWEINRAVRASKCVPAPSKLIMLTLSDIADAGTAEIPERMTPSLKILAGETGLDEATVKRHLTSLENTGWIKRDRPTQEDARQLGERTRYQLTLGAPCAHEGAPCAQAKKAKKKKTRAHSAPNQGAESAQSGRTVRPIDKEDDLNDQNDPSSSAKPRKKAASKPKKAKEKPAPKPVRDDVMRICVHLADRVEGNGCKRPDIGEGWLDEARLLLDRDGRTEEQVHKAIDWCQDDSFWRSNIRSMGKLRSQYDQIRLRAIHEQQIRNGSRASPFATPASSAPGLIPDDEKCPEHADQHAKTCRHCAARRKAGDQ
jgi:hypothetical protein